MELKVRPLRADDTIEITLWTIYGHPADFPDHWVVRSWHVIRSVEGAYQVLGCPIACLAGSLREAWETVPIWASSPLGLMMSADSRFAEVWI